MSIAAVSVNPSFPPFINKKPSTDDNRTDQAATIFLKKNQHDIILPERKPINEYDTKSKEVTSNSFLFVPPQFRADPELFRDPLLSEYQLSETDRNFHKLITAKIPYVGLRNFRQLNHNTLQAAFRIDQPLGFETGPMCSAEVGRHLALLGACTAAQINQHEQPHHYLARKAVFERLTKVSGPSTFLYATATAFVDSKNSAHAVAYVHDRTGNALFRVDVQFDVISEKVFSKFWGEHKQDARKVDRMSGDKNPQQSLAYRKSPYTRQKLELSNIKFKNRKLIGLLDITDPFECSGHFPMYPALPVAKMIDTLTNAGGLLLQHTLQQECLQFSLLHTIIEANELAFAGEKVRCEIDLLKADGHKFLLDCRATTLKSGKEVGRALSTVNLAHFSKETFQDASVRPSYFSEVAL